MHERELMAVLQIRREASVQELNINIRVIQLDID